MTIGDWDRTLPGLLGFLTAFLGTQMLLPVAGPIRTPSWLRKDCKVVRVVLPGWGYVE